ncbi:POU domain, class 6, transcription factor 2-like [Oreochromis aureus]|uniref:POU domain, class 6, transcription factor 2-like n=1 Tax=Oreochromis aureus TaxID=47969 RepID=UPI0019547615|nr:POU domain, class 6, transcription factor 2-like [Oreochromis aureus]
MLRQNKRRRLLKKRCQTSLNMVASDIGRLAWSSVTLLTAACLSPDECQSSLQDPMITGQLSKPLLSLRSDMSAAELRADDKAATPDSDLNDEPLLLPSEATDREGTPNKLYGARDGSVQSDASSSPSEQSQLGQTHPAYPMGPQSQTHTPSPCACAAPGRPLLNTQLSGLPSTVQQLSSSTYGEDE